MKCQYCRKEVDCPIEVIYFFDRTSDGLETHTICEVCLVKIFSDLPSSLYGSQDSWLWRWLQLEFQAPDLQEFHPGIGYNYKE